MRALIGRSWLKLFGWSLEGELPSIPRYVFIAAPHTSNWDLTFMLAAAWALKVRIHWLGKHTLFVGPFGRLFRALGGVPVDRRGSKGLVGWAVELYARGDVDRLAVAPEGSRGHRGYWQSGFYRIAHGAGVPVAMAFLDYRTRRCGLGPLLHLTGDVTVDMDRIRAFYGPFEGRHPQLQGPIRLRVEDAADDAGDGPRRPESTREEAEREPICP